MEVAELKLKKLEINQEINIQSSEMGIKISDIEKNVQEMAAGMI